MGGDTAETVTQTSKPVLDKSAVPDLVHHIFGLTVTHVKELNAYDDLNFHIQVAPVHSNPFIKEVCPDGYTLKALNSVESKRPAIVEAHNQLMWKLKDEGFSVPYPTRTVSNTEWSVERLTKTAGPRWRPQDDSEPASDHVVRLLAFVPGQILHSVPYTPTLIFEMGEMASRIANCLKDFHHPVYDDLDSSWYLRSVPRVAQFTWVVKDPTRRHMAEQAVERFTKEVVPVIDQLPQGMLHGDLNEQNLLVSAGADGQQHIAGLIDFGDSHRSALVFELALVIMYMMVDCPAELPRLDVGGHALAGYRRHRALTPPELKVLKTCVCARFAQSLVLGAYAHHQNPANEYVLMTATNGWTAFAAIWEEPEERLYARWEAIGRERWAE
ncbi:Hydroxylysine kinase [Amphibalanus amphitrite]|uniref:Hydroxylysine kinase n=1 Tax=Amphibalanus amphitrite TaxID=1232801 RepID=A0A6A4UWS4_AMPAM|nr:Hydroxylysine kinase [Amphibalanus amphitrite]KAF0288198.1 Hydroxylysine kinase [Amphibalanus amphitrite]